MSDIGEVPIKSVPKFPENIRGAQLLAAPNIWGARAPVPPLFLRLCVWKDCDRHIFHSSWAVASIVMVFPLELF